MEKTWRSLPGKYQCLIMQVFYEFYQLEKYIYILEINLFNLKSIKKF